MEGETGPRLDREGVARLGDAAAPITTVGRAGERGAERWAVGARRAVRRDREPDSAVSHGLATTAEDAAGAVLCSPRPADELRGQERGAVRGLASP